MRLHLGDTHSIPVRITRRGVKSPAESKYDWDYYKLVETTPADQAFRPLADGGCALVHR